MRGRKAAAQWLAAGRCDWTRRSAPRTTLPAGKRSGWPSPGPWPRSPRSCCSTSHWLRSTLPPPPNCATRLRRVLTDRTTILVTHEPLDAALIADRMAVLDGGTVVEEGTVADVLGNPRSAFAADLLGVNLIPGTAGPAHTVILPSGQLIAGRPGPQGEWFLTDNRRWCVAPSAVVVHLTQQVGSARNTIPGTITGIERLGTR